MEILINKRNEVFLDDQLTYFISSKFSILTRIKISDYITKNPRLVLKELFVPFKRSFDIIRDDKVFHFRLKKAWKTQFNCQVENDLYEIYSHRGRKYSVFKNNIQVAWWESDLVILFGNKFKIIADKDADYELLIAFCIILESSNGGSTLDLGNVGGQGKSFDAYWQPKY